MSASVYFRSPTQSEPPRPEPDPLALKCMENESKRHLKVWRKVLLQSNPQKGKDPRP